MSKITKRRYLQITIGSIFVILLCLWSTLWTGSSHILVSGHDQWSVKGAFTQNGEFPSPSTAQDRATLQKKQKNIDFWASWSGDDKLRGRILSTPFKAPAVLGLYVAGYPNQGKNQIFLKRLDTKSEFPLKLPNAGEHWVRAYWILPSDWKGAKIRLIAVDRSAGFGGWLGISSPLQLSWTAVITAQLPFLATIPVTAIHLLLLILPGFLLMVCWQKYFTINSIFTAILSILFSAILGYIAFWLYWLNSNLGSVFSIAVFLGSIIAIFFLYRYQQTKLLTILRHPDFVFPISGMLLVSLLYLAIFFTVDSNQPLENWMMFRFRTMPPDNIIPKLFADKLYADEDLRPPILGDWLSSDRPPLQTGILLLQYPILTASTWSYQILSTIIQCAWIPAIWTLCRTIYSSSRQISLVFGFAIFSGFFFFNSLYVWPKFLAASLIIFAFSLLICAVLEKRTTAIEEIVLASLAIALGLLSHGGVIFTLPVFLPLIFRPKNFAKLSHFALLGCLVLFFLMAPWSAYQKIFNPPGNRLVKWHLAGVIDIDSRTSSKAIIDAYTSIDSRQILDNKLANTAFLFNSELGKTPEQMRENNFFRVFNSLGVLNLGWVILVYSFWNQAIRNSIWFKGTIISLLSGLASLAIWIVVMFGPATTAIHQGSYATMALLFVGLTHLLSILPNLVITALISINALLFAYAWIFTTPPVTQDLALHPLNFVAIFLAAVFTAILGKWLMSLASRKDKVIN